MIEAILKVLWKLLELKYNVSIAIISGWLIMNFFHIKRKLQHIKLGIGGRGRQKSTTVVVVDSILKFTQQLAAVSIIIGP